MTAEVDADKDASNIVKHGVSLSRASDLEILAFIEDDRAEYGETRYRAWGLIDDKTYCSAFTRRGGKVRAISLRRAHKKEMDHYARQVDFQLGKPGMDRSRIREGAPRE